MKFDKETEEVFEKAYLTAKENKHEYISPEHILYGILNTNSGLEIIDNCGGNIEELKKDIKEYFEEYIPKKEEEPVTTVGFSSVIQTVQTHALSAGNEVISTGDLIVAIYDEEETFASYFLKKNGIKRLDVLRYISHEKYIEEYSDKRVFESEEENNGEQKKESILKYFTIDLTEKAEKGNIDPVIGREDIIKRTMQILARRIKNNPIHVGEPGVGKTAITEGLAKMISEGNVPEKLKGSRIFYLDIGGMLAGTRYRGDFEERIKKVLKEIESIEKSIIYIDEIHTIVGAGAVSGGAMDAANILKPFLTNGKIKCIGATTYEEYKKFFEKDKALSRRFQKIEISEPGIEDTILILKGLKSKYEEYHNVEYTEEALRTAAELSAKYINDKHLPDKAIDVIDEAGAVFSLENNKKEKIVIGKKDIEKVIAETAKIPENSVSENDIDKLKTLEIKLKKQIYGQHNAIENVVKAIKISRAGFRSGEKPIASFLFVGPTGVGKTELAKQLAEIFSIPLLRFDMSEYQEKHSVSKFIGAPPGYVGYEEGGLLTNAVRKNPHSVLLLDEIEKAHQDIYNVLLQVMDYATLTETGGLKADFRNIIIIMTSNAGARELSKSMVGFGDRKYDESNIKKEITKVFAPEFRNRLDDVIIFNGINNEMAELIVIKELEKFGEMLKNKNIILKFENDVVKYIVKKGFSAEYGAREIARCIEEELKPKFVDEYLFGSLINGGEAKIYIEEEKLKIKV